MEITNAAGTLLSAFCDQLHRKRTGNTAKREKPVSGHLYQCLKNRAEASARALTGKEAELAVKIFLTRMWQMNVDRIEIISLIPVYAGETQTGMAAFREAVYISPIANYARFLYGAGEYELYDGVIRYLGTPG